MDADKEPRWVFEKSRSGEYTAYVDGIALHSTFNPVKEAGKAAAGIPDSAGIVVLAGFGLGYVAEAILKAAPERPLIIAEADETTLEKVNTIRSITSIFNHPEVCLLAGGNPDQVQSFLIRGPVGSSIHYLPWLPAVKLNPEWYRKLEKVVAETSRRKKVNANTLERFGKLWIRNLAANCSLLPDAISVDTGKNSFAGIPALILAGGPSLEKILPRLKEISRKFVVIAVDTALKGVLRTGVIPDVIAAVDPQYWNTRHLDWCETEESKPLILAETSTHPAVFRKLTGRCIMMRTRFPLGTVLEDAVGLRGELNAGGSVATAAWDLARHFGCQPIVSAGLDLGYPGRRTHYVGSLSRERPHFYSNRLLPAQTIFFHSLCDGNLHKARDMAGRLILTDQRMDIYHAWFAEKALEHRDRSPGILGDESRFIRGMSAMSIDDLLNMSDKRFIIDENLTELKTSTPVPSARNELKRVLFELISALKHFKELADEGLKAAIKASAKLRNGRNPDKQLAAMAKVDEALMSSKDLQVTSFLMQPLILELTASSRRDTDPLDTSKHLYDEIEKSASYHLEVLEKIRLP